MPKVLSDSQILMFHCFLLCSTLQNPILSLLSTKEKSSNQQKVVKTIMIWQLCFAESLLACSRPSWLPLQFLAPPSCSSPLRIFSCQSSTLTVLLLPASVREDESRVAKDVNEMLS